MKRQMIMLAAGLLTGVAVADGLDRIERDFSQLPPAARRNLGPLFWLHGDESKEQIVSVLEKVRDGGNGTFTVEPRPHKDWLGEGWYRDLGICVDFARANNLTLYIFDDWWWPSQMMGGRVPPQYGSKVLESAAEAVAGPREFSADGYGGDRFIAAVAGRVTEDNAIEPSSLVDLRRHISGGRLAWKVPEGNWRVMRFTWAFRGKQGGQQSMVSVDGADKECVAWFINAVYQPHYDRFSKDFGKTIQGYFYDEPETQGDWGREVGAIIAERKLDLPTLLVAYKYRLSDRDAQTAAFFAYLDCFVEAWGRTMYGGMSDWCRKHNVASMGHFMEHGNDLFSRNLSGGNMMQLQKYSDMGAIDLVCDQLQPGNRNHDIYQMPKIASSIAHVYNKKNDIAADETFGGYGQRLTYPTMKWLTDWQQVRGVNYLIPHSFNVRAPFDYDYPPYFYNRDFEPRYALYRVWADYTSRLSVLLTGGEHVAPVAFLYPGLSVHLGKHQRIEPLTGALQDALYDCDWVPYDAFIDTARIKGRRVAIHKESYPVLIVPAVEVIPCDVLEKAVKFFEAGGVVLGYDRLPTRSATIGRNSADIARLTGTLWGQPQPGLDVCKTSAAGGKSFFLPAKPTAKDVRQVLAVAAGVVPTLDVIKGETGDWLHVLQRRKNGQDVFLVCNQNLTGGARPFTLRISAPGEPECWDAMRNEITKPVTRRVAKGMVEVDLALAPLESVLLVFRSGTKALPARLEPESKAVATIPVNRVPSDEKPVALPPAGKGPFTGSPVKADPYDGVCEVGTLIALKDSRVCLEAEGIAPEEAARVTVNGTYAGGFIGQPLRLDVTRLLKAGSNRIRIDPFAPATVRLAVYR